MNITIEFNLWTSFCLIFGVLTLLMASLRGLGRFEVLSRHPRWFGISPLASALGGAGLILMPIALPLSGFAPGWTEIIVALFPFAVILMGSLVERYARAEPPYNQSLQQTFDPVANSADAESSPASNAAELQRYVSVSFGGWSSD